MLYLLAGILAVGNLQFKLRDGTDQARTRTRADAQMHARTHVLIDLK